MLTKALFDLVCMCADGILNEGYKPQRRMKGGVKKSNYSTPAMMRGEAGGDTGPQTWECNQKRFWMCVKTKREAQCLRSEPMQK